MSKKYITKFMDEYHRNQAKCKCGHILGQHTSYMLDRRTAKTVCSAFGCECPNFELEETPNGIVGHLYGFTIEKDFDAITGEEILTGRKP